MGSLVFTKPVVFDNPHEVKNRKAKQNNDLFEFLSVQFIDGCLIAKGSFIVALPQNICDELESCNVSLSLCLCLWKC